MATKCCTLAPKNLGILGKATKGHPEFEHELTSVPAGVCGHAALQLQGITELIQARDDCHDADILAIVRVRAAAPRSAKTVFPLL